MNTSVRRRLHPGWCSPKFDSGRSGRNFVDCQSYKFRGGGAVIQIILASFRENNGSSEERMATIDKKKDTRVGECL